MKNKSPNLNSYSNYEWNKGTQKCNNTNHNTNTTQQPNQNQIKSKSKSKHNLRFRFRFTETAIDLPLLFWRKSRFDLLNLFSPYLKRLRQHIVRHRRRCGEKRCRNRLSTRQLAVECCNHRRWNLSIVLLEVDQSLGEHEDLAHLDRLRDEDIRGGYEADVELAFDDEHNLGGARVCVRWIQATGGIVDPREGNAERVQAGDKLDISGSYSRALGVVC